MPIYEYNCPKCGSFEAIQKHTDAPLKANPECTRADCPKKAVRAISASAFHLKGGGWYKDGYAGGAPSKSADKSTTSTETKSSESKSETKASDSSTLKSRADGGSSGGGSGGGCGGGKCGCH